MITFKQLEAIYWVVETGSFFAASQKLNTTQSAVSKRVQELEAIYQAPLFDRSMRTARLTSKGEVVFSAAGRLLEERDGLMSLTQESVRSKRRVRIGVTEVTAMTWLPRYVDLLQRTHPEVRIDPEVESGLMLRDKLLGREIDLMIAADSFRDERFIASTIGKLPLQWMCKPGLVRKTASPLKVQTLLDYPILTQGPQSGTGILFQEWFQTHGLKHGEHVVSNSLLALIGLTVSGFGISYLPTAPADQMVKQGLLEVLDVRPVLPSAKYAAIIRKDQRSTLLTSMIKLAQACCDFTKLYQIN